jgi:hypothetical protein
MKKKCLSCGRSFTLSGSGKCQKLCSDCRKRGMGRGWGFSASNSLKIKALRRLFQLTRVFGKGED